MKEKSLMLYGLFQYILQLGKSPAKLLQQMQFPMKLPDVRMPYPGFPYLPGYVCYFHTGEWLRFIDCCNDNISKAYYKYYLRANIPALTF